MLTTTVCAALSAAGLAVAFLTAYRRRFAAALRIAAFALVPIGLAMAGLLGLLWRIGRAVGSWGVDLALQPTVWSGFAVLALAVVLYLAGRAVGARGRARSTADGTREASLPARTDDSLSPGRAAPENTGAAAPKKDGKGRGDGKSGQAAPPSAGGGDDFSDIEEILKKHGI